jgi:hypothetical protein
LGGDYLCDNGLSDLGNDYLVNLRDGDLGDVELHDGWFCRDAGGEKQGED